MRLICICSIAAPRKQAKITTILSVTESHQQPYLGHLEPSRERYRRAIGTSRLKFMNVLGGPLTPLARSNPGGKRHSHRENSHNCWRMLMCPAAAPRRKKNQIRKFRKCGRVDVPRLSEWTLEMTTRSSLGGTSDRMTSGNHSTFFFTTTNREQIVNTWIPWLFTVLLDGWIHDGHPRERNRPIGEY